MLLLVTLSVCLINYVHARGVAVVGSHGGSHEHKVRYVDRTFEDPPWYWLLIERFASALVAGGVLATLVLTTCCVCCCCHFKRKAAEKRSREQEDQTGTFEQVESNG